MTEINGSKWYTAPIPNILGSGQEDDDCLAHKYIIYINSNLKLKAYWKKYNANRLKRCIAEYLTNPLIDICRSVTFCATIVCSPPSGTNLNHPFKLAFTKLWSTADVNDSYNDIWFKLMKICFQKVYYCFVLAFRVDITLSLYL